MRNLIDLLKVINNTWKTQSLSNLISHANEEEEKEKDQTSKLFLDHKELDYNSQLEELQDT